MAEETSDITERAGAPSEWPALSETKNIKTKAGVTSHTSEDVQSWQPTHNFARPRGRGRGRGIGRGRGRATSWKLSHQQQDKEIIVPQIELEAPLFTSKIQDLRPGKTEQTLTVKVIESNPITLQAQGTARPPMAECIVGDDTAVILLTARGSLQVDMMKPGALLVLRNARVGLFKGSMRLNVDNDSIEVVKWLGSEFDVNNDNNMSLIDFEVVTGNLPK